MSQINTPLEESLIVVSLNTKLRVFGDWDHFWGQNLEVCWMHVFLVPGDDAVFSKLARLDFPTLL